MSELLLRKTLTENSSAGVFNEISCPETLGLKNPNQLRMFYLNISKTSFSYIDLEDFLSEAVGTYVLNRAELADMEKRGRAHAVGSKAIREMLRNGSADDRGTGNELGEILLYYFLEEVLDAPKLLSKVELKKTASGSLSDAVHLKQLKNGAELYYQMVFGASNISGDLGDAVDRAFEVLDHIIKNEADEIRLVSDTVLHQHFEADVEDFLIKQLKPSSTSTLRPETAYGIFLGYTIDLDKSLYLNREYPKAVTAKMETDIKANINHIIDQIKIHHMENCSFYIYILPLDDAEKDKRKIMRNILMLGGDNNE